MREEASEVREANGTLLALGTLRYRGKASGVEVTSPVGWVLEFRDGKIARGRTYIDPKQAVKGAQLDLHAAALAA